jgi:hypothetical protein
MNANEWIGEYAKKLGIEPPTQDEFKAILDLAAPVACWLSARAGLSLEESLKLARELSET